MLADKANYGLGFLN